MTRAVETYNETPALNNFDIDEGGAPEGHQRVKVNDSNRERMSALASLYQDGLEWLDLLRDPTDRSIQFTVAQGSSTTIEITSGSLDLTALFNVGRRIKTTTAGVDTDELEVLSSVHADPLFTVTIYSAGGDTVTAGIDGLLLHSSTRLKRFAFRDTLPTDYIVMGGLTDADFVTALATATTNGGGTILLLVGTTTLTQGHTVPFNTRIIGQGIGASVLDCTVNTPTAILTLFGAGSQHLESFTLQGTSGGVGTHGIHLPAAGSIGNLRITDLHIKLTGGDGIRFEEDPTPSTNVIRDVILTGITIESPKGNGIFCDNPNTNVERCQMSNITVFNTGGTTGTSYGVIVSGQWELSNIDIGSLNGVSPKIQVGVAFTERLAVAPNEQDSNQCTLHGLSVSGTGQDARGVDLNGRFCAVIGGSIVLTGSASKGVLVAGTLGQQQANNNRVQGLAITASVGFDEVSSPGFQNQVVGCQFNACGIDVRIGGDNTLILGNQMKGATLQSIRLVSGSNRARVLNNDIFDNTGIAIECLAPVRALIRGNTSYNSAGAGISVASAAVRTHVFDNQIEAPSADGINVASGSSLTRVLDNLIEDATGDGIAVAAGATAVIVSKNRCINITGDEYSNLATTDCVLASNFPMAEEVHKEQNNDQFINTTEEDSDDITGQAFPAGDGGPDSSKEYVIDGSLALAGAATTKFTVKVYIGATGDSGDTLVETFEWTHNGDLLQVNFRTTLFTPAPGDKWGLSFGIASGTLSVLGDTAGANPSSSAMCRRFRSE